MNIENAMLIIDWFFRVYYVMFHWLGPCLVGFHLRPKNNMVLLVELSIFPQVVIHFVCHLECNLAGVFEGFFILLNTFSNPQIK